MVVVVAVVVVGLFSVGVVDKWYLFLLRVVDVEENKLFIVESRSCLVLLSV